jgi:uncharacterized membrane protein (DUF2068 family)
MQPNPKPLDHRAGHSLFLVRLIAIAKFLKAGALLVIGYLILHMLHVGGNLHDSLHEFVNAVRLDPNNVFIHGLLEKATGIRETTLHRIGVGTLIYGGLYLVEGFGLFLDLAWAEWMTVITTLGFVPVEIAEVIKHPTILRIVILVLNVLIVIYIAMRIHWRFVARKLARTQGPGAIPAPHVTATHPPAPRDGLGPMPRAD